MHLLPLSSSQARIPLYTPGPPQQIFLPLPCKTSEESIQDISMCLQDYFIFCAFSLALQILAFVTVLVRIKQDTEDTAEIVERVIDLFIAAWPSLAPAVVLFAAGVSVTRLQAAGISTLQPDNLDAAAHTEIVCFDKTGTLTANMVSPLPCYRALHVHTSWHFRPYSLEHLHLPMCAGCSCWCGTT